METMEFPNARQTFATSIADIAAGLKEALACEKGCSNTLRRHYYAKIELLRLDVEEFLLEQKIELLNTEEKEEDAVQSFYREITATCDELTRSLKLLPVHRGNSLLTSLDNLFRLLCFNLSILNTGAFCALPLMILKAVLFGRIDSKDSPGEAFRRWIGRYICTMCGFRYEVAGLENVEKTFGSSCSLLAFSHASNLDGFVLASSCPIDMITVAKKELFLLPFFGWISLAIGAVALDRSNRERAVTALQRSAERAQGKRMCISIAPEGTRSTTGQLLPFKKGMFHIWEQVQAPIVPVVIFGAFELWHPKNFINSTGKVIVEYLSPVHPSEATSREHMQRILRRRMLEAYLRCPESVQNDISPTERFGMLVVQLLSVAFDVYFFYKLFRFLMVDIGFGPMQAFGVFTGTSVAITVLLYVYNVYYVNMSSRSRKSSDRATGERGGKHKEA